MSEAHSTTPTTSSKSAKPGKPYPEFPLTAHPAGYWCKKIRGKLHYFGPWANPDGALAKYLEQKDALHAGRTPRPDPADLTVKELANLYLNAKQQAVDAGELSPRTWADYRAIMDKLVAGLGKQKPVTGLDPQDFASLKAKLAKRNGPARMCTVIQVIRSAFKHAYESGRMDKPMRFGPAFRRTSKKVLRLHRARRGARLFVAEEIREMVRGALVVGRQGPELAQANPPLKAMILLGINCGFGNSDCANLPLSAVDLEGGWIDYPRPKTGIGRRCPLWPETVEAIREALARRPRPKKDEHAGLVFLTKYGKPWAHDVGDRPVTHEMRKLLDALGINGHRNFYTLRHTFRTVADEARDQPAADFIMGHESPHMSTIYRERISDERLKAVADYVRAWLFPAKDGGEDGALNQPAQR